MNRIDRLFGMATYLQGKKYASAEQIAAQFGMSVRTVYRDLKALNDMGIPVTFEDKKGYTLVQGYFLPPVSFNTEEANALLMLELVAQTFTDRSVHAHYTSALNKVKAVLRKSQQEAVEVLSANTHWQTPPCMIPDYAYLSDIQKAISARQILHLQYANKEGDASERHVEPIGLIFYAFSWHLIGWCHLRQAYRDFKVSRIGHLSNTLLPFSRQEHPPIGNFMEQLPVKY